MDIPFFRYVDQDLRKVELHFKKGEKLHETGFYVAAHNFFLKAEQDIHAAMSSSTVQKRNPLLPCIQDWSNRLYVVTLMYIYKCVK